MTSGRDAAARNDGRGQALAPELSHSDRIPCQTPAEPLAIVTGADSGIGRATAIALAKAGHDLLITYRSDRDGASETVSRSPRSAAGHAMCVATKASLTTSPRCSRTWMTRDRRARSGQQCRHRRQRHAGGTDDRR
ncbi:SDR family NAD(P)-dependent oxidoreductase (plasmid) [Paracoccus marcusii]|uniref:SDR family NAD(P)-dependent oxidoreductase n=1 Tax=Paracoccus marcusii TaxID=59779 RepID=UPI002ED25734|nr:SDR family NAD(P)-dependent oxidoreductase [Paracoccus marcusii]